MYRKTYFLFLVAALALVLSACQSAPQKAAEQAAENAIEDESGGEADVDIDEGQMNINTEQGNLQFGENVSLPADFPADVYVYEGAIKGVITNNDPKSHTLTIETDKAGAEVKTAYEGQMADDGWKITATMDFGDTISLAGEKDNRTMSVMIGKSDDKTSIVLGVSEK